MIKIVRSPRWGFFYLAPVGCLITVSSLLALAESAGASGISITEQSVTGLGNAFAGSAAIAEDASTIYFNPAGLTRLKTRSSVNAVYGIIPSVRFKNQGSTIVTGEPLRGGNGGDAGVDVLVPNLYIARPLSKRVVIGLGINAPFGQSTDYQDNWVGRYQALKSKLVTININPTLAVKLTDTLSAGVGVNLQYAKAELSNAIDFGLLGSTAGLSTRPQSADGLVKVTGDDWSWGYNLGLLYEPTPRTRIGLAYRSPISHTLIGTADFRVPSSVAALTQSGQFTDTGAKAPLDLPDSLSLSAYHQINPRLALMADVTRTDWSRFKELRVDFNNPVQPDTVQPENWHDTYRVSLGANYAVSKALLLRAGIAYDPAAVNDRDRSARTPGSSRTWLAIGSSYRPSESLSLNFGYAHLFTKDASIDQESRFAGNLRGSYKQSIDIIGVQFNWRF